ncbi:response regulator transcription factor [Anaeropeptidivorans aminofermentans]|uniref:response regulator transcription factor n=1 Tax=Anaeropeptidivorans aminofermentans TaxID=2934315 RepID=UPI0020258A78|nr:response regulator transcription factor [Anaeropeptidivorans aminofermentans]
MKILIVEDEIRLAEALMQIMKEQKYIADIVGDGAEGLHYALNGNYDVIILDIMLPSMTGYEIVKTMRLSKNPTPVLMLTARDEIYDKVQGLDFGADDYMTKPFSTEELLARIRALSRRQGEVVLDELIYGDLHLGLLTNTLSCGKKSVHLGFKEFEIMKILMSSPNAITPKEVLIDKVWGENSDAEDNNVEAYISFLRKKFFFLNSKAGIETIRKVGYKLEGGA